MWFLYAFSHPNLSFEGGEADQGSASETPAGRAESTGRVSGVTSGSPEHKPQTAETPSKNLEAGAVQASTAGL